MQRPILRVGRGVCDWGNAGGAADYVVENVAVDEEEHMMMIYIDRRDVRHRNDGAEAVGLG